MSSTDRRFKEKFANRKARLSKYRIRSGDVDSYGHWHQGSYDEYFGADDFDAATDEADRALRDNEIRGIETGRFIRVDGLDRSARRAIGGRGVWHAFPTSS